MTIGELGNLDGIDPTKIGSEPKYDDVLTQQVLQVATAALTTVVALTTGSALVLAISLATSSLLLYRATIISHLNDKNLRSDEIARLANLKLSELTTQLTFHQIISNDALNYDPKTKQADTLKTQQMLEKYAALQQILVNHYDEYANMPSLKAIMEYQANPPQVVQKTEEIPSTQNDSAVTKTPNEDTESLQLAQAPEAPEAVEEVEEERVARCKPCGNALKWIQAKLC